MKGKRLGNHTYIRVTGVPLKHSCQICNKRRFNESEGLYRRENGWNGLYICGLCLSIKIEKERLLNTQKSQEEAQKEKTKPKEKTYAWGQQKMTRPVKKVVQEAPAHLQWAVKHPFQGGGFSGK